MPFAFHGREQHRCPLPCPPFNHLPVADRAACHAFRRLDHAVRECHDRVLSRGAVAAANASASGRWPPAAPLAGQHFDASSLGGPLTPAFQAML